MHVLKQRIINYHVRMDMGVGCGGGTKHQPVEGLILHQESVQQSRLGRSGDRMCELEREGQVR